MVNLTMTTTFLTTNATAKINPNKFCLQLGDEHFIIPSISRPSNPDNPDQVIRGGVNQINLRGYESFCIENQVFQDLVNSARDGGDTTWLNRIIFYVNTNVLQVDQDGTVLTSDQILNYVSP